MYCCLLLLCIIYNLGNLLVSIAWKLTYLKARPYFILIKVKCCSCLKSTKDK